jgi:hypothetical protein
VLKEIKNARDLLAKNAELVAKLKVSDERIRRLQQENKRLKPKNQCACVLRCLWCGPHARHRLPR